MCEKGKKEHRAKHVIRAVLGPSEQLCTPSAQLRKVGVRQPPILAAPRVRLVPVAQGTVVLSFL